eukprot:NODE_7198_length_468_cov_49.980907_g6378_i0.p2 GENE.NODE_7198_length_468_cov_49.980907_g6378_i0~~NODE_7198_length_468_cov_49.980907_g6378_i0.p2  ORF type:complete len:128 (-),score=58.24 NODE_7198_length_468_cov_49.980907_g6378_i0:83-424(-)
MVETIAEYLRNTPKAVMDIQGGIQGEGTDLRALREGMSLHMSASTVDRLLRSSANEGLVLKRGDNYYANMARSKRIRDAEDDSSKRQKMEDKKVEVTEVETPEPEQPEASKEK